MACIIGQDGNEYCDGDYAGVCSREKQFRHFDGMVSYSAAGRVMATGRCEVCNTPMTVALFTP